MKTLARRIVTGLVVLAVLGGLGWLVTVRLSAKPQAAGRGGQRAAAPVEVAAVEHGPIE